MKIVRSDYETSNTLAIELIDMLMKYLLGLCEIHV